MTQPESSSVYDSADHDNNMLPLALGALSMLDIFAEAVRENAQGQNTEAVDDALLDAALGLLSLRRTLHRWANHAAGDHAPKPRAGRRAAPPTHILR